ncbi:MAG: hypothetical protein KC492_26270, partial [Myxococcales bacterium]|nr:hypothetical protein [Myxococcales bacterium]
MLGPCSSSDTTNSCVVAQGVDDTLLQQRQAFLRPGSNVAVVVVGDEDDCSIQAAGQFWLALDADALPAHSTATCQTNPNDPCCYSCAMAQKDGCFSKFSECEGDSGDGDDPALRCWDQKRRMGIDFMYPIERYVAGLKERMLPAGSAKAEPQPNPLFSDNQRAAQQVQLLVLGGAPVDFLAETDAAGRTRYRTNAELTSAGRWPALVGDPSTYVSPSDPFMLPTTEQRVITSSLNGLSPIDTNAVNGGDVAGLTSRLQFACIDALPTPVACDPSGCFCETANETTICDSSGVQTAVPAYPTIRQFAVAKDSGGEIASLCQYGATPGRLDTGFGASYELLQQA